MKDNEQVPVLPGFNLNQYIAENRGRNSRDSEWLTPRIECADGFSMSVQASRYNYCSPRDHSGPYSQAEVGFPSSLEESLMEYCEDSEKPTGTVYGYVPVEIIEKIVDSHGGIARANGIGGEVSGNSGEVESPKTDDDPKKISAEGFRQHLDEMLEKSEPHNCCPKLDTPEANEFREHLCGAIQLGELSREVESEIEYLVHLHVAVQKPTPTKPEGEAKTIMDTMIENVRTMAGNNMMTIESCGWLALICNLALDSRQLESDLAAARADISNRKEQDRMMIPFLEWAQSYLNAGRWAGHHLYDAVQVELIERDDEVNRLRAALEAIRDHEDAPYTELCGDERVGVHCGVEDRGCSDRYEGADYGYQQGMERGLEWASNAAAYALAPASSGKGER